MDKNCVFFFFFTEALDVRHSDGSFKLYNGDVVVMNIRIFNGCEVLIENSVTRVTVRHHEALPSDAEQLPE